MLAPNAYTRERRCAATAATGAGCPACARDPRSGRGSPTRSARGGALVLPGSRPRTTRAPAGRPSGRHSPLPERRVRVAR
jgi:hypothetical protein